MPWDISERNGAVVLKINSNPVNKLNPDFFREMNEALDEVEQSFPTAPLVLTAEGKCFSSGLDFDYHFPMFAEGDQEKIAAWFEDFRHTFLRLFEYPRPTVAAVNGHAFAGGLILALCCDWRVVSKGRARFALNEVAIGVPMPSVYVELLRYRLGDVASTDIVLSGRVFGVEEAVALQCFQKSVESDNLIDAALGEATRIAPDCMVAYAQSKRHLLHPVLRRMDSDSRELEVRTFLAMASPQGREAQERTLRALKEKSKSR